MMEQGPTWFAERKETLECQFLDLLVFRGNGGATAAQSKVHRDEGSKKKKFYGNRALEEKEKEQAWKKMKSEEKVGKREKFPLL